MSDDKPKVRYVVTPIEMTKEEIEAWVQSTQLIDPWIGWAASEFARQEDRRFIEMVERLAGEREDVSSDTRLLGGEEKGA